MFLLLVISPEKDHRKEIEIIASLFDEGLKTLHLRKPSFTEEKLRSYLQKIPKKFHKRIVIHSHYNLTDEFNLKGVHLPEKERKLKTRNVYPKIISTSFHTTTEILKSRKKYDYVFLSPIFDSISKKGYKSNFTSEELNLLLKKRKNVIALGGINPKNIKTTTQIGFTGAAVLGYLWKSKDSVTAYKELVSKIK
jgi:thiamine-phosphate pyrophosphorylase